MFFKFLLYKLLIECISLSEKAGLRIDAVTCDGATWNRAMWDMFGVTKETVSVEHIIDENRRLWFLSDFPHLIKCLRNFLIQLGIVRSQSNINLNSLFLLLCLLRKNNKAQSNSST